MEQRRRRTLKENRKIERGKGRREGGDRGNV